MLLAGAETIRDVIAFPKAASGADPLTGAPTPITPAQRKEAGVDATPTRPSAGLTPSGRPRPPPPRGTAAMTAIVLITMAAGIPETMVSPNAQGVMSAAGQAPEDETED